MSPRTIVSLGSLGIITFGSVWSITRVYPRCFKFRFLPHWCLQRNLRSNIRRRWIPIQLGGIIKHTHRPLLLTTTIRTISPTTCRRRSLLQTLLRIMIRHQHSPRHGSRRRHPLRTTPMHPLQQLPQRRTFLTSTSTNTTNTLRFHIRLFRRRIQKHKPEPIRIDRPTTGTTHFTYT